MCLLRFHPLLCQFLQILGHNPLFSLNYLLNINGGIHIIKINDINNDEINLLYACSDIILDAHYDLLEEAL